MLCFPAQGFIIESDYEGDDGHPRIGLIQPGTAANEVLVQGDIIVSINGTSVASHADAAKAIKAVKTGDVVIKVLAKKPRGTAPALAEKEVALEADAEREAATKMQATIRGNNARKEQAADPAPSVKNDVFQNIKTSVQGAATKVQELVNPTSPRSSAAETAVEQGSPVATDDERDAATKMQAMLRGNQSRKAMANGETPAAAPAEKDQRKSFGKRERPSFTLGLHSAQSASLARAPGRRKHEGHDAEDRHRHRRALRAVHEPTQDAQYRCRGRVAEAR